MERLFVVLKNLNKNAKPNVKFYIYMNNQLIDVLYRDGNSKYFSHGLVSKVTADNDTYHITILDTRKYPLKCVQRKEVD